MIPQEWIDQAVEQLDGRVRRTPLTYDTENDWYLKWENQQVTGSFKARGATHKVLSLEPWERSAGLVTASAGNHGQGVALAAKEVGARVIVFVSEEASPVKLAAMRDLGAEVRLVPGRYADAEKAGKEFAARQQAAWISPYNDPRIIAGQATLGLEMMAQLAPAEAAVCVVPAGGGGLLAGIGLALQRFARRPALVGVQAEASAFLHALYHRNSQDGVVDLPSLADGLGDPVEEHSITIPVVRSYTDDFLLVNEEEIAQAIAYAWHRYGERIEGSGAAPLAAVLSGKVTQRPALLVISGGNIQAELHAKICAQGHSASGEGK